MKTPEANQPRTDLPGELELEATQRVESDASTCRQIDLEASCAELERLFAHVRMPQELAQSFVDDLTYTLDLPGFRQLGLLGRGGFGRVYLAQDERLVRRVAIKVPYTSIPESNADSTERVIQEARMIAGLQHPGIVTLHDVIFHQAHYHLISEYVDGGTLEERLIAGPVPLDVALDIGIQLADALSHAHQRNVVHRDLKPRNILLGSDRRPRITDFGLAIRDDQHASDVPHVAGTLEYLAPEQLTPAASVVIDGRTDLWAMGVILYRLLTGRMPFNGRGAALFDEIRQRSPKPPRQLESSIPVAVEAICLRCLEKDPHARFSSAAELRDALRQQLHPPRPWVAAPQWLALAVLALASVWGLGLAWHSHANTARPAAISATTAERPLEMTAWHISRSHEEQGRTVELGELAVDTSAVEFDDDLRFDVQFSRPAYAYFVEFSCNGQLILHAPDRDTMPPERRSAVTFPTNANEGLGLVDGTGLHVFCVIASTEPLPPFDVWYRGLTPPPWQPSTGAGIWRFAGGEIKPLIGAVERSVSRPRQSLPPPTAFATLCHALVTQAPGLTIEAVAIPVLPRTNQSTALD